MGRRISRARYAELFGPTTGDRVRLGDTELWAEVERDLLVPGDECVFGGGKTLRDGLGTHGAITAAQGALDFVITNVLVIDAVLGIVKCDIGIKDGRIAGIGKAGNPQVMDGVLDGMVIGANTDVRSAEGMIATAGAIDVHVHFDSAGLCEEAIASGITTMLGGGLGPVTVGITSSGTVNLGRMLQASEAWPINFGFLGKGSAYDVEPLLEQGRAGAIGLKIHEDWGAMPAVIDARCGPATSSTCRCRFTPTRSTSRGSSNTRWRRSTGARSTPTTRRAREAATRRTSSGLPASPTASRRRPTRRIRSRSTRSTSTSTW